MDAHLDEFVLAVELRDAGSGKCCWCKLLQFEAPDSMSFAHSAAPGSMALFLMRGILRQAHKDQLNLVVEDKFSDDVQPQMRYEGMEVRQPGRGSGH